MRVDYRSLADLRYHIRGFLAVREAAARAAGLEPQQYLLLLQIKDRESDGPATVGMLAERLHIKHHSAVELVDRLCARKLVARRRSPDDRRQVIVEMRPAGRAVLERLAIHSLAELRNVGPALIEVLARLIGKTASRRSAGAAFCQEFDSNRLGLAIAADTISTTSEEPFDKLRANGLKQLRANG